MMRCKAVINHLYVFLRGAAVAQRHRTKSDVRASKYLHGSRELGCDCDLPKNLSSVLIEIRLTTCDYAIARKPL